ncbi:hypothetical protein KUTeg_015576 [Tegillarca granosa]|uniref:Uncharacterized protein n=1 Tax=Tegillarca granosa TaxID=220873 RepID=A0ABQ9EQH0_TEGGR|nr:hypothetical protein KUTeg_015576 [Tegillarca granosa]
MAGLVNVGCFDAAFVLGLEMVGPSKRVYTGIIIEFIWCLGECYLLIAAYFVRNWRYLQLAFSVPIAIMALYCW